MSGPQIIDCEQGSQEWFRARMGLPTASVFGTVLARGKKPGEPSLSRRTYLYKLAGEIITGEPSENYSNGHMDRGKTMEAQARADYSFERDIEVALVGFVRNGRKGCSPDGLIGGPGALEIKTKLPHLMVECLFCDDPPPEHMAQCQGVLWVTEREWVDLSLYWPKMPPIIHRITRDNGYIANLAGEIDRFNDDLDKIVERIRAYGQPHAEAA